MCAELRRLGLQVLFADETRLLLATRRATLEAARQAMGFVLDSLAAQDAFQLLALAPESVFAALLWLNPNNFAGFRVWSADLLDRPGATRP